MSSSSPGAPALGVGLYSLGVFLFALNDALGKWLVADYGVGQLLLLRSIGAGLVLAPMIAWLRVDLFDFTQWPLQLLRILCMAADTYAFYWATRYMPLADVMTFYMAAPLIVTALSAPLLGERVERFRWIAVAIGFVGVVIALRPSPQMFTWASLLALFGATMFALGQTVTRKLRRTHWLPLVVWQFAGAGLIGAATTPFAWVTPGRFDLALMFLVGVVSMTCFIFLTRALAMVRAAVLAPLQYVSILWASVMGWLVWRDTPTLPIVIGNAIIIASGLYILVRGSRSRSEPQSEPASELGVVLHD
jgi:S-adenosylmethionine uptake transporter